MRQPSPKSRLHTQTFSLIAQEFANAGISFRFQAIGQSMYPTIKNGEMIYVAPLGSHKLRRDDIVLAQRDGKFRAHRIIQINDESFIARGDASLEADGNVEREEVVGLVIAKECGITGKLLSLAGPQAHARFHIRRLRARVGDMLRTLGLREAPSFGKPTIKS